MKRLVYFFLLFIFFSAIANGIKIKINVAEKIDKSEVLLYNSTVNNVFELVDEIYNIGSVAYKTRVRMDVFNASKLLFTAYSKEVLLNPGAAKTISLYWFSNTTGNYTARIRTYYAGEIGQRNISFRVAGKPYTNIIQIRNVRTYDKFIVVELSTPKELNNIVVVASNYSPSWIFETVKISKAKGDVVVKIPYSCPTFTSRNIVINAFTLDGKQFTSKVVKLEKKQGILYWLYYLFDYLRIVNK